MHEERRGQPRFAVPSRCLTKSTLCMQLQISLVVWMFQYPPRTAAAVGLSMAQIGEFAFVLLSSASQHGLLAYQVYMLLMGAFRGLVIALNLHGSMTSFFCRSLCENLHRHWSPVEAVKLMSCCRLSSTDRVEGQSCEPAGVTGLSLLITPFIMQLSTRYLQLDSDDGKVGLSTA